ncbi:MAG: HAMP domain-containing histidine kinase, partial [Clostridiales bacterium]|nr:HAMP domain-containing histidine kinase [Clostridiales bacterium]
MNPVPDGYVKASPELLARFTGEYGNLPASGASAYLNFHISGTEYTAVIRNVADNGNNFNLGWIIVYSSLQKLNQLQLGLNLIMLVILLITSFIILIFSSQAAKKISSPFSSLNQHLRAIAERNFSSRIHMPVDDELKDFVNNINLMSEKLATYDKAQKTFLQNVSHEFRTPLMSIQSYAEGIKYEIISPSAAADIIMGESRRMTHLVEDLLYLSRLDMLEENYDINRLDICVLMSGCIHRLEVLASQKGISFIFDEEQTGLETMGDSDRLFKAITNILENCIRYAVSKITVTVEKNAEGYIKLVISDDGPGFEADELPHIFERFYKGKKGNSGLGLAISSSIVEKHNGRIMADNGNPGAIFTILLPSAEDHLS